MRKTALGIALLLTLTGACSAKGSVARPPATTLASEDAAEAATVDKVLAGLDGVVGDVERTLVKDKRITTDVTDRLRAVYTGPELLNQIDAFRADVDNGLVGYKNPPGNRVTTVSRLITVSPICIFVEVARDYSPATAGLAPKPTTMYVVLVTKNDADDPKHLNPTTWAMLYDGVQADGSQPEDICR
jgi:hypothetical protein